MRKRVLVVENEADIQNILQAILEQGNCEVDVASDGLDALEKLETEEAPDLIFLDLMMPRMDGYSFVQEMRRRQLCPEVPIIVLSGDMQVRQQVSQMGMEVFISKPFTVDEVLDIATALLEV